MTTLEILRQARSTIADPNEAWNFGDWCQCTCGHIYRAGTGRSAAVSPDVGDRCVATSAPQVLDAYKAIVRVLGLPVESSIFIGDYAKTVSKATRARSSDATCDDVERKHALALIDDAIAALEAEHERNRLDVLAQTQHIVDSVPVEQFA